MRLLGRLSRGVATIEELGMMKTPFLFAFAFAFATAGAPALAQRGPDGDFAVGPQYDTTHVYVPAAQYDAFMRSFVATFGGKLGEQGMLQVTPTPSGTKSQLAFTPAGTVSAFGFLTPIPVPFGGERNGYLVADFDAAVASAVRHGAVRLIYDFPDKFGRDVVVQWPGGVNMQFYMHNQPPSYAPLATVPENRVYVTPDGADAFLRSWTGFAHARVVEDRRDADGGEIGEPGRTFRRVRLSSGYGDMLVMVSDGKLPWPYGVEPTGYAVPDLPATLARAKAAGVELLVPAHEWSGRSTAMLRFPGGFVAEVHSATSR